MKKIILYLMIIFSLLNVVHAEEAIKDAPFEVTAKNIILYNLNDDQILYEKNSEEQVAVASLTKIMTAIITIENITDLDQQVEITKDVFLGLEEYAQAGLQTGQKVSYEELLYGVLLPSGADAVNAIVLSMGGQEKFVELMNQKAKDLNLSNTHFDNAIGMDSEHNYSTASDIATLLKYALENEKFKEIFTKREYTIERLNLKLSNTLTKYATTSLDVSYITGAKSGFTDAAGYCLASIATLNEIDYLLVNLGSDPTSSKSQAVKDATTIYKYYSENYSYQTVIEKGQILKTIKNKFGYIKEYEITAPENLDLYLKNDIDLEEITYTYQGVEEINYQYQKNDKLGTITITYQNQVLDTFDVYLNEQLKYYHPFLYLAILIAVILAVLLARIIQIKHRKKKRRKKRR